ncbi:hypothetical protein B0H14DRAFT_3880942 [Mycena olivaceomarginata]|nr:hypothetical protein B0H14DRAFT_3880942 [Mycena olivaceomarginata]
MPSLGRWQAPKCAPISSTPSARAMGDDDAWGRPLPFLVFLCAMLIIPPRYASFQHLGRSSLPRSNHGTNEERRKIVACCMSSGPPHLFPHSGRIADIAQNCCRYRVLQKALDCKEEEVCLLTGSELLQVDPATTLVNKHASHVSNEASIPASIFDQESKVVTNLILIII